VAISQWILGVKPDYDGLKIDPCIPRHGTDTKLPDISEAQLMKSL